MAGALAGGSAGDFFRDFVGNFMGAGASNAEDSADTLANHPAREYAARCKVVREWRKSLHGDFAERFALRRERERRVDVFCDAAATKVRWPAKDCAKIENVAEPVARETSRRASRSESRNAWRIALRSATQN
jgi:hypothetical protein